MKNLRRRRVAGFTVVFTALCMAVLMFGGTALAEIRVVDEATGPGVVCPTDWNNGHLAAGADVSGPWGSASSSSSGVNVSTTSGFTVDVCVKAGTRWIIYRVSGNERVPSPDGKGLSHWAWKVVGEPGTTTSTVGDTTSSTVGDTTSSTVGDTTSSTVPDTSVTTSTTVFISPTSIVPEPTTTTPEVAPTSTVPTTVTTVVVKPTTTKPTPTTTTPSITDDTLPFTGVDSDHLAIVALLALGAGSALVAMTPKNKEDAEVL